MGPQYSGYPALIFWDLANWGKNNESNLGLLISLEKLYSHVRAKLPTMYNITDERMAEIESGKGGTLTTVETAAMSANKILDHIGKPEGDDNEGGELTKARKTLHALRREDDAQITEKQEEYLGILFGIYENLDQICADSRIIDNERMPAAAPPAETT